MGAKQLTLQGAKSSSQVLESCSEVYLRPAREKRSSTKYFRMSQRWRALQHADLKPKTVS